MLLYWPCTLPALSQRGSASVCRVLLLFMLFSRTSRGPGTLPPSLCVSRGYLHAQRSVLMTWLHQTCRPTCRPRSCPRPLPLLLSWPRLQPSCALQHRVTSPTKAPTVRARTHTQEEERRSGARWWRQVRCRDKSDANRETKSVSVRIAGREGKREGGRKGGGKAGMERCCS